MSKQTDLIGNILRQIASTFTEVDNINTEMVNKLKEVKKLDGLNSDTLNRQIASLSSAQLEELLDRGGMMPDNVKEAVMDYLNQTQKKKHQHKHKLKKQAELKAKKKLQHSLQYKKSNKSRLTATKLTPTTTM